MPKIYNEDYEVELEPYYEEEPNGIFDYLRDIADYCIECGYDGPLILKKRGYICPECQTLVLEHR